MIEYSNRVWAHSKQQGTKLVLLLAIADMTNENYYYCWPSLETLQEKARLAHRQNAIRAIDELESAGELWVERGRGRACTNAYVVTVGMSPSELANILITRFDHDPTDALQQATDHINKCSPQAKNVAIETHIKNVAVERENVASTRENVAATREKRSRRATRIRRNQNRTVIEPEEGDAREDQPATSTEPPAPTPTLAQADVDEFVNATNVPAHAPSPTSGAPPSRIVLDDPPTGPPQARQFDPRQLDAGGLWPEGTGQTAYEVYREAFATIPSRYQIRHMNASVTDLVKWREVTQKCAMKNFKSYDNVFDVYQNGFRQEKKAYDNRKQPTTRPEPAHARPDLYEQFGWSATATAPA